MLCKYYHFNKFIYSHRGTLCPYAHVSLHCKYVLLEPEISTASRAQFEDRVGIYYGNQLRARCLE